MADAELTLVMKARNLASGAVDQVSGSLDKVTTHSSLAQRAFAKLKGGVSLLASGFMFAIGPASMLIGALLKASGADKVLADAIGKVVTKLAVALAPTIAVVVAWLTRVIAKVQDWVSKNRPLIDQITSFVGGALSKLVSVLATVVGWIGSFIGAIARSKPAMDVLRAGVGFIATGFAVMEKVLEANIYVIGKIIGAIVRLIGKIREAIAWLAKLNLRAGNVGHDPIGDWLFGSHAEGGWVGLHGPELAMVGERGPEYITPNHQLPGQAASPSYELVAVSKRDLARMVDEQLYFTLRRAAPTGGRI